MMMMRTACRCDEDRKSLELRLLCDFDKTAAVAAEP
jgi:hypothetical protein